jgi:hypothetical protein
MRSLSVRDDRDPAAGCPAKPILVYSHGRWRRYRGSRELLDVISLGDIIPELDVAESEDPAAEHLHSNVSAPADLISLERISPEVWKHVCTLPANFVENLRYPDPFSSP